MTRKEIIQKLKDVLAECTETEFSVCYLTYEDKEWLEFCINSLEIDELYQLEYEKTIKELKEADSNE